MAAALFHFQRGPAVSALPFGINPLALSSNSCAIIQSQMGIDPKHPHPIKGMVWVYTHESLVRMEFSVRSGPVFPAVFHWLFPTKTRGVRACFPSFSKGMEIFHETDSDDILCNRRNQLPHCSDARHGNTGSGYRSFRRSHRRSFGDRH